MLLFQEDNVEIKNSYQILSHIAILDPMWPHPSVLVPRLGAALTSRVSFRSSYELFFFSEPSHDCALSEHIT
jgi:hypothetical protein